MPISGYEAMRRIQCHSCSITAETAQLKSNHEKNISQTPNEGYSIK